MGLNISAVLVTRGDRDLAPILDSLPFDDVVVWNNREREDVKVYGRYAAIVETRHELIYVQDDDCLVPIDKLLERYEGGRLCNMSEHRWADYPDSSLIGWGAIFPRNDPFEAFRRYVTLTQPDDVDEFHRCCDCVFTALKPFDRVDVGHEDLPWATAPERMYHQQQHYVERAKVTAEALACV